MKSSYLHNQSNQSGKLLLLLHKDIRHWENLGFGISLDTNFKGITQNFGWKTGQNYSPGKAGMGTGTGINGPEDELDVEFWLAALTIRTSPQLRRATIIFLHIMILSTQ